MKKIMMFFIFSLQLIAIYSGSMMSDGVSTSMVTYDSQKGIKGFLAQPEKKGKYPGIILIHEWWGLNDYIYDRAKDFAKLGYVALAVDLYEGRSATKSEDAGKLAGEVRNNVEKAFDNLSMAINYLKTLPNVNPNRLASIGWCFGGGWSYEVAKNNLGVKVSVMYYGRFSPDDDLKMMKALIIGNFGGKDLSIKVDTVKEFQATLKKLNRKHEIYIYPNAGHAFDNKYGERYDKEASELAWDRTIKFLKKNLR